MKGKGGVRVLSLKCFSAGLYSLLTGISVTFIAGIASIIIASQTQSTSIRLNLWRRIFCEKKMEQEKFNRVGYLQDCCNRYGDFKVASTWKNNQGELCWSKHRSVLACWHTDEGLRFLERVNHRSCFEAEIILDIENDDLNNLKKIVSDLLTYTNRFKIFSTGSRGFHIHCIFPELASKSKDYRMKMRDVLIDKYGTDKGKRKESDMIAIEYVPHWKSGKIKEEISIDKIRG